MSGVFVSSASYQAIGDVAEKVGQLGSWQGNELDVFKLVAELGGRVNYGTSAEGLRVYDKRDFEIRIPAITSGRRDRFTIAHELGHFIVHYLPQYTGPGEPKDFHRGGRDRGETQANVFAASLLMPAARFRTVFRESAGSIGRVAREFGVSPDAASVRAQVLGL